MTKLLEKAFAAATKLPDADQDALAQLLLDEIAAEGGWDDRFARSQDLIERMATEALAEHAAGLTTPLDPDRI